MIFTYLKRRYIGILILLSITINALGLLFPITRNDDLTLYASIAKNIILSHDWVSLMHPEGIDWLDKPHLPFWIIALSFKIFGINSFAYLLCGYLFNLIGGYYTFCLAKVIYNRTTALFSALIYFSAFHLQLSASMDVRAEAYLMGMIIPACYYWYCYYKVICSQIRNLLLGAVFTACAIMTKGIFTIVTIFSGVGFLYVYSKRQGGYFTKSLLIGSLKWGIALLLTLLFIAPELITLYLQFDSHPEKIIFGNTHVSGIKWFFWDSQFGRFFNTGPISRSAVSVGHYLFFVHTFMWAFLPWSILFVVSLWYIIKHEAKEEATIYLLSSFFITFIMFSVTKFQLDYYTNIIIPFAAIICARWLYCIQDGIIKSNKKLFIIQKLLALLLTFAVFCLIVLIFHGLLLSLILILSLVVILLFVSLCINNIKSILVYSVVSINLVFIFILIVYGFIAVNYDIGYKIDKDLNKRTKNTTIIDFRVHSLTLEFYSKNKYMLLNNINELKSLPKNSYIVTLATNQAMIVSALKNAQVVNYYYGTTIDKVMANLLNIEHLNDQLTKYVVIEVD